jgi:hypothetical protein
MLFRQSVVRPGAASTQFSGQQPTFSEVCAMSALPPKADIGERDDDVRFVP